VARRKAPPGVDVRVEDFPESLRRGSVVVEDFVPWSEQPPEYWGMRDDSDWREIRAMRRWQAAVQDWGAQRGLSDRKM
jgi:hypothetical protein